MAHITQDQYDEIISAGNTLCNYCESDECEKCIVPHLLDDARIEAIDSGLIEDD